jgi:hypothetical protein
MSICKSCEASCYKYLAVFTFYEVSVSCLRTFISSALGFHYFTRMKHKHPKMPILFPLKVHHFILDLPTYLNFLSDRTQRP